MNTKISRETILKILNEYIDETMIRDHYNRRKNSNIYYKNNNIVLRKLIFSYHTNPYYNQSALIRIYPYAEFRFYEVNEEAKRIFENDYETIFHTDKVTIRQPIGFFVETEDWLIYDVKDYSNVAEKIKIALNSIVLPVFERCSSLDGFANEFVTTDNFPNVQTNIISVIITLVLIREKYTARLLLEKYFNKKGMQNIYIPIYRAYFR